MLDPHDSTYQEPGVTTLVPGEKAGHDLKSLPAWNTVGKVYIAFITAYTIALVVAIAYACWYHHGSRALRIRGTGITALALLFIHMYLAALFIVYPLNGYFLCGTEFWSMNTLFPLGIAFFLASNLRLKAYGDRQRQLLDIECYSEKKIPLKRSFREPRAWWNGADLVRKTYACTAVGLLFQLITTLVLYNGSRRFMPLTGFFGEQTDAYVCRTGGEWASSIAWQFIFAWLIGPYLLWKTWRMSKDTHYWRLQTFCAVVAGMPGAPLWIATLYTHAAPSSGLAQLKRWWPPAMWFAPGLIVMQLSIIICTGLDLRNETRAARHEARIVREENAVAHRMNLQGSFQSMQFALKHMYQPFLLFAATKDFTAENVLFVTRVREYKAYWLNVISKSRVDSHSRLKSRDLKRMYEQAARIYFELVNPRTARFPVNVGSKHMQDLSQKFRNLRYLPDTTERISIDSSLHASQRPNTVCPWEASELTPTFTNDAKTAVAKTKPVEAAVTDRSSESDTASVRIGMGLEAPACDNASDENLIALSEPKSMIPLKTFTPSGLPAITPQARMQRKQVRFAEVEHELQGGFQYINDANLRSADMHVDDYVPYTFSFDVFDKAATDVKRDIYNNTWKHFVNSLSQSTVEKMDVFPLSSTAVARRGGKRYSQMTEVEAAEWAGEMEDDGLHHGVLDSDLGPIPIEHVDARCGLCRRQVTQLVQRIFKNEEGGSPEVEIVQDEDTTDEEHEH